MKKVVKRVSFYLLFCIFLFLLCFGWLFFTGSGFRFLQTGINNFSWNCIYIGQVDGRLSGRWSLQNLQIQFRDLSVSLGTLQCNWSSWKIIFGEVSISQLFLRDVVISLKDNANGNLPDKSSSQKMPIVLLPLSFEVDKLLIEDLQLVDQKNSPLLIMDLFRARLETDGQRVAINDFLLQGPDYSLSMHGFIEAGHLWQVDLLGNLSLAGFGFQGMEGTFSISGSLDSPDVQLGLISPADIRISAKIENMLDSPEYKLKLEGHSVDLSALIENCPEINLSFVTGDLSGNTKGYRGLVKATGAYDLLDNLELTSTISADWWGIDFLSLRIEKGESFVQAMDSSISWKDIFSWEGHFIVKDLDLSQFHESLPTAVSAEFINHGNVLENGVDVSFNINTLEAAVQEYPLLASGTIFLTETGISSDGFLIQSRDLQGSVAVRSGHFLWSEKISWSADFSLQNFDPSWVYPGFPGNINGSFVGFGELGKAGINGALTVEGLSGNLRGNELSGGGKIDFRDGDAQTSGLVIRSGQSELVVSGSAGEKVALDISLLSPDIGQMIPNSGGTIKIKGNIGGSFSTPEIDLTFEGEDLFYAKDKIDLLAGKIHLEPQESKVLNGSLSAENIRIGRVAVKTTALDISGTFADHEIIFGAEFDQYGTLRMKTKGSFNHNWDGQIYELFLKSRRYGDFALKNKAALKISLNDIQLDSVCLRNSPSEFCLGGEIDLSKGAQWSVQSFLRDFSLDFINQLNVSPLHFTGRASGNLIANGDENHIERVEFNVIIPRADMELEDFDEDFNDIKFVDLQLEMNLSDGVFNGNLSSRTNNDGLLKVNIDIEGLGDFSIPVERLPVEGQLEVVDFDPSFFAEFTDYTVIPKGKVDAHVTVSGTVGNPQIVGKTTFEGGTVLLPFQGITLKNTSLQMSNVEKGINIQCSTNSGKGHLFARGMVRYGEKGIEGDVQITGEDFELVHVPEYKIQISPDVHFLFNNEKGIVDGIIKIPSAFLSPEEIDNSVTISDDVVYISKGKEIREAAWPFFGSLGVELGDDVRIDGYGLRGKLEGALQVGKKPETFLSAEGELNLVDGTFDIYSTELVIERGRVLFTGGPIDNPGLDIRAQKTVRGGAAKGEGYIVGVDISGLVHDLEYRLFSDPYMDDTEILSSLAIGSSALSFGDDKGGFWKSAAVTLGIQGGSEIFDGFGSVLQLDDMHLEGNKDREDVSLVVGKLVTKDLYIGYDINMFNQLGEFRVRYDLDSGFFVETRSSTEATGADLLYIFEK